MNEQLRNIGNENLYQNINYLSKISYEISDEFELLNYIKEKGDYFNWETELFNNQHLLLSSERDESKNNILIYTFLDSFSENNESKNKGIIVTENKIYTENTKLKGRNIFNIAQILSLVCKQYETNYEWELLSNEYNIMLLISSSREKIPKELLSRIDCEKIMICIEGDNNNLLEITQMNNSIFEITKHMELAERKYNNGFSIKTNVLFLNNVKTKYEKEEFNALNYNLNLVLKIQDKFNIEILDIYNNSKMNDRKYSAEITISAEEQKITPIMQYIKEYHEALNESLKLENVSLQIELKKVKLDDSKKVMKNEDIEVIVGILNNDFKKSNDNSVLNFAELHIDQSKNILCYKGLIKSENIQVLEYLKGELMQYCGSNNLNVIYLNEIPLWGIDKEDVSRKKAIRIYRSLNSKQNKILTVSKSKYTSMLASYTKYNQSFSYIYKVYDEDERECIKATEITKLWSSIGNFLDELICEEVKENFYFDIYEKKIENENNNDN